jgi:tRNA dimethylallyltransferase
LAEYSERGGRIPLIAVVGPTATGKTRLGAELCLKYGGEVISGDSMQIYKEMNTATAKPSKEEMMGIPHHLIDFLDPGEEFSVADYVSLAHKTVFDIWARGKQPFLVGGTGLYISSFLEDIYFADVAVDQNRKAELEKMAARGENQALHTMLAACDPQMAASLNTADNTRIIRGILVFEASGKTLTEYKKESRPAVSRYDSLIIGLNFKDRAKLYERINKRVDLMLEADLLDEAKSFYSRGLSRTSRAAIGYKELYPFIRGEISLEAAAENLKRETRRYAKRQCTWFNKNKNINWIYIDSFENFDALIKAAEGLIAPFLSRYGRQAPKI